MGERCGPTPLVFPTLGVAGSPDRTRTALREAARPHKRADTVGRDSLDSICKGGRMDLLRARANPASPCTTVTSSPSEGVKRCVTLWCGLHVPHCAHPGLDMPLQRRRKLPAWGSPGWGYRQRCSCPRRGFGVFHSPHGATCVASGSNGARLSFLAESSLGKAANWTRRRGLYSVSGPLSTLRPAGLRHPGHSPHAVPRLGTRPW